MATQEQVQQLLDGTIRHIASEKVAMAKYLAVDDMGGVKACLLLIWQAEVRAAAYRLVLS